MAEQKRRIHHLAKELDVKSKAIIEKCHAEGLDQVKNHMFVVSAGLEATIREWFSEGAHTTTLEESDRVDLKSVRVKPKKKKKTATVSAEKNVSAGSDAETTTTVEAPPSSVAVMEPPAPPIESGKTDEAAVEKTSVPSAAPVGTPAEPEILPDAPPAETPSVVDPGKTSVAAEVEQASPTVEPEQPVVVGPQNVPEPAKLTGPKVIRIDRPERVDRPRPAARSTQRPPPREVSEPVPEDDQREERRGRGRGGKRGGGPDETAGRRSHPRRGLRDNRQVSNEQLHEWRERDVLEMRERLAQASGRGIGAHRAVERKSSGGRRSSMPVRVKKDKVELTEPIRIKEFSRETGIPVLDIVNKLRDEHETMAGINSSMDTEHAQLISAEYGIELIVVKAKTGLDLLAEEFAAIDRKRLMSRPPIVTVLGHVDHGKTSLLDRIRKANVTAGEAGGITQHVGAYRVRVGDKWVTFLDTPGHAAFTAMRARGANMTDVVVLVVAADDGVMPTTIEAINHAKAAETTIVVALNKIDLEHDLNKIYGQLTEHGLTPSGDWGGDTDVIKTSATTGQGIDELLSHLATLSEVLELKADATIAATGTVIEAERSDRIGNVARLMVQEGTLNTGQVIVCGAAHGRVRSMKNDSGANVKKAGPSTPVEVTGLSDVPEAGDKFYVLKNAQRAKEIAEEVAALRRESELTRLAKPTSLESVIATAEEGQIPELNVIIRADVQGSIDALKQELTSFPDDEVKLNIMHTGVGTVTESDIVLAQASDAIIIAFYVVPDPTIQRKAEHTGVDIRTYRVIYEVIDDIKKALEGLLTPEERVESRGRAEVREIFSISRVGKVAGCFVRDGLFNRNYQVRVIRDGVPVKDRAELESLRRFKDDVKEVKSGLECGIRVANFDDVKPGDIIEAIEVVKIARTLQPS